MSKSKSSSKSAKAGKVDVLTKVKDAAITKPAQTIKAKAKDIAKQVVAKDEKKDKKSKKIKEPTPEPSDSSEDEDIESAESDSSESERELETKKPVLKGKSNGVAKSHPKEASSDESESEADSDSGSDSEPEVKAPNAKPTVNADLSEDDSDGGDSDDSSEDEKPTQKSAAKNTAVAQAAEDESGSDSSDSDDSDESDKEEDVPAKPIKRKAEEEVSQVSKKSKPDAANPSQTGNLFVGNLSWNVDEAWLREVFEEFGELSGVRIVTDRDSGRSKGFGYVEFVNAEDAGKAHAAKAGAELDGRAMNVDFANARPDGNQKQENRRKSYGDQLGEPSDTLFLGNLSFEVGQEAVTEAFTPHGTILGIRLPTDRETGQPKGFGYVTFASVDEAKFALEAMQGQYVEGRPLRIDYSSPRPQNGDSPARGRGGFGGRGGGRGGRGGRGGNFSRGGFGGRGGGRGGRGGSTNRGGFGDFSGRKTSFD